MPTPFYHLSLAEELLEGDGLPPAQKARLAEQHSAFLLGNVAPDVQVVSGQTRQATHFFDLPIQQNRLTPWENLWQSYPQLADLASLPPAQAAFLAGYLCHLQTDWLWILEIFVPVFGMRSTWGSFGQRLYLHNVLRAYLDQNLLPSLNHGIGLRLQRAAPEHWLPFVGDEDLRRWRDFLAGQLQPGGKARTVEVFADRQGYSPEEYYRLIGSEEAMEHNVFSHLPRQTLDDFHLRLVQENQQLLARNLNH
jgi:hypothetical protein